MRPIERLQLIWTTVTNPSVGTRIFFPDVPELRKDVLITGLELVETSNLLAVPDGTPCIGSDAQRLSFTFAEGSTNRLRDVPGQSMNANYNFGIWREFVPFLINWQRSYLTVNLALTVPTIQAVPLLVHFIPASNAAPRR